MGAWEDGFMAGWIAAMNRPDLGFNEAVLASRSPRRRTVSQPVKSTRKGKAPSGMSKALKIANKKAKLKSGKFRKGWNRSRMMKYAHKIRGKK